MSVSILSSCEKYLRQISDPEESPDFEDDCGSIQLNTRLWSDPDEKDARSSVRPSPHAFLPQSQDTCAQL